MRASKASPASPTPLLPSRSFGVRPRRRTSGPTRSSEKSLVPPPKSPIRYQFVVVERRFVGAGGRDRLHFEIDTLKTGSRKCRSQARNSKVVVFRRFRADEANRAAHHGIANRPVELLFRILAQVGEHAGDQIFELVATAKDFRSGERAAGKVRLERLNEAALFLGLKITLDCGRAGEGVGFAGTVRLGLVQDKAPSETIRSGRKRRERRQLDFRILIKSATELFVVPKSNPTASSRFWFVCISSIISQLEGAPQMRRHCSGPGVSSHLVPKGRETEPRQITIAEQGLLADTPCIRRANVRTHSPRDMPRAPIS